MPETPQDEEALARVKALARSGQKIEAIKAYRVLKGCSLSDAKDAVDALSRRQPVEEGAHPLTSGEPLPLLLLIGAFLLMGLAAWLIRHFLG